jgi:hypothetical protein
MIHYRFPAMLNCRKLRQFLPIRAMTPECPIFSDPRSIKLFKTTTIHSSFDSAAAAEAAPGIAGAASSETDSERSK